MLIARQGVADRAIPRRVRLRRRLKTLQIFDRRRNQVLGPLKFGRRDTRFTHEPDGPSPCARGRRHTRRRRAFRCRAQVRRGMRRRAPARRHHDHKGQRCDPTRLCDARPFSTRIACHPCTHMSALRRSSNLASLRPRPGRPDRTPPCESAAVARPSSYLEPVPDTGWCSSNRSGSRQTTDRAAEICRFAVSYDAGAWCTPTVQTANLPAGMLRVAVMMFAGLVALFAPASVIGAVQSAPASSPVAIHTFVQQLGTTTKAALGATSSSRTSSMPRRRITALPPAARTFAGQFARSRNMATR